MRLGPSELVAKIEFLEWTESDHLRHSKFAGLREDKDARTVAKELGGERTSSTKLNYIGSNGDIHELVYTDTGRTTTSPRPSRRVAQRI